MKRHALADWDLATVFDYINPNMLYGRHLGLKGSLERLLRQGDEKAAQLHKQVRQYQHELLERALIKPRAVYQFFRASSVPARGELRLHDPTGERTLTSFRFPRQSAKAGLCLADYVRAPEQGPDYVALFVTGCGEGIREEAERLKAAGKFLESHMVQAIAIECAEALAELLHEKLRAMWGIPDPVAMPLAAKFSARYRGLRVSFGYPACPRLEDQTILFEALGAAEATGVRLTEGFMMEPEASVSALVLHHPQARYFGVGEEDVARLERELAGS